MTAPLVRTMLSDDDSRLLNHMLGQIRHHKRRNDRLTAYYNGKVAIESLGIAIPKEWDVLNTIVGWPAMPIDVMNERLHLDKLIVVGDDAMTTRLNELWERSNMQAETVMLQANTFMHGTGFMVGLSDPNAGPLIVPEPATRMTGIYDRKLREMTAAATNDDRPPVWSYAKVKPPPQATLYLPGRTVVVERHSKGWAVLDSQENPSNILPVERLVNRPDFERVWGASEMTRALLSYTDSAVRTLMGMEVSREFYAAPQRYLLGVEESDFQNEDGDQVPAWLSYIGKQLAIGRDDEGNLPTVGQFAAASPEPFIAGVRMLAQMASAETGIAATRFGFVTDNPTSADAIRETDKGEIAKAEQRRDAFAPRYARAGKFLLLADGVPEAKIPKITCRFRNVATTSLAGQGDFTLKMVQAKVLDPEAESTLRQLPFSEEQITEILAERRRKAGSQLIENLAAAASAARTDPTVVELASRRTADAVAV